MKTLLLSILLLLPLTVHCESENGKTDNSAKDNEASEQTSPDRNKSQNLKDQEPEMRGFDPCLLNANLPVCQNR